MAGERLPLLGMGVSAVAVPRSIKHTTIKFNSCAQARAGSRAPTRTFLVYLSHCCRLLVAVCVVSTLLKGDEMQGHRQTERGQSSQTTALPVSNEQWW